MKTKCTIAVFAALLSVTLNFAQRIHCPECECRFQPAEQVYVFGNDVKLRSEPNTESKVLELLKMGEWVEIIEMTNSSWPYNGYDSPFYKVKYDDMTGYILGGLLSLEKKTVGGTDYFFAYSREGEKTFLNVRSMYFGRLLEKKIPLASPIINIKTYGNRGIENLDGIIFVHNYSALDDLDLGGNYIFAFEGSLTSYQLSQTDYEDASYYSEKFVFPDEEKGIPGKIIFKKEEGLRYLDEENKWLYTNVETWKLHWGYGQLVPNFREKPTN
ncbi:SH3 domain-containing protein [Flagellimonas sp.]|uniref:SH3 domain-containing protein n=1 Tax=Flagellimonas sp. TaxID=2058762 RepID=UPI003B502B30